MDLSDRYTQQHARSYKNLAYARRAAAKKNGPNSVETRTRVKESFASVSVIFPSS